jgi:hypothetical protein
MLECPSSYRAVRYDRFGHVLWRQGEPTTFR